MTISTRDGSSWEICTFPPHDQVLATRVREILAEAGPASPDAAVSVLKERLGRVHPAMDVRVRTELAGLGGTALYVFRDGRAVSTPDDSSWVGDPAVARVVTDGSGIYLAANDAAAQLFGVPPEEIVGKSAGTFTRDDALVQDREALWRVLEETGMLHSRGVLRDGRHVEFVTVKDGDGPGRHVTSLRELPPGAR